MAVTKEILALAVEIGDALLRNGAEVYRVEDTVMHILEAYEIENYDVYVLSNGIFASANEDREDACSMIRHIPLGTTHLGRIAALNQLSREICSHEWTVWKDVKIFRSVNLSSTSSSVDLAVAVFPIFSGVQPWTASSAFLSACCCRYFCLP